MKKHRFTKEEKDAYLKELDAYFCEVKDRVKIGTITRAKDHLPQDFSDPVYVGSYLDKLKQEWNGF